MKVTEKERELLIAIRDNEMHDGQDPIGNPMWINCINFPSKSHGGVMVSLVKKKLAGTQRFDGTEGVCWITAEGAKALMKKDLPQL